MSAANKSETHAALTVRNLSYHYSGGAALFQDLSFSLTSGSFTALLAPSGMGKTTLFRLLAGLLQPTAGEIVQAADHSDHQGNRDKRRIGYMPQRDCLMPWRTVQDNAALGLELSGMSRSAARSRVLSLLPAFGLADTQLRMPHELSGGMRQRVSFLRAMLGAGSLLLLDEPFSALDAMTRINMQEWLLDIQNKHRKTILFITHDVDEALLLSDRLLIANQSPVTSLYELEVGLPRPRTYDEALSPAFIDLKRQVLQRLGRTHPVETGGVSR